MEQAIWVLLGVVAVLIRAGLALYAAGTSRAKNAGNAFFRAIADVSVGILAFWGVGAAILAGTPREMFDASGLLSPQAFSAGILVLLASSAITAGTLERSRAAVCIAGSVLMCGFVCPACWRLASSHWLARMGFIDEAGGSYLHLAGGLAAGVAAVVVGPRNGKYNRDGSTNVILGHSAGLTCMGVLLIWALWPLYAGGFSAILAGAAGAVAAMCYSRFRFGKFDLYFVVTGLLGALVSITAAAGKLPTPLAVLTGAIAGITVPWVAGWIDLVWKIDDPAAAIAIHGAGGLTALLAAGLFVTGTFQQRLQRLGAQAVGIALISLIALAAALTVFLTLRATLGVRSKEADEYDGLDLAEHDSNAYPDFQQTMIKSYHLREI